MKGFRDFILRGNVVDLAVGVVIGAAFAALVSAFGKAFLNPLIALFVGTPKCDKTVPQPCEGAHFVIRGQHFVYGEFITGIITFLITAAVVYFFVVRPLNALMERYKKEPEPTDPTQTCPECLSSIPAAATRCLFCTTLLATGAGRPAAKRSVPANQPATATKAASKPIKKASAGRKS